MVTAIILAITAISIPIYLNSRNEAHDTKARENIEHVGNQAASRLIRDRAFTYSEYRTPQVLADTIMSEDPSYDLVPLSDGDGEYRYISEYVDDTGNKDAIGVGINDDGALVLATMSGSGRCWMLVHDPAFASDAGFSFAEADPNFCGWTEGWATNDGVVSPDGPVAANATLPIAFRGDPSDPAELFNLNDYVTLPSGAGISVFSILADSQLQEASPQLAAFNPGTGELSFEAPLGVSNATFTLDYQVTLPDMDNASDTGRLTFRIGTPPITALGVTLTCDTAPYEANNIPYGHLVLCTADTGEFTPAGFIWSAPGAAPFDCDNQASCLLTRSNADSLDVSVEVVDLSGPDPDNPISDAATLVFTAHAPLVTLECASDVSYASPATCTAIASDPNQEVLSYLWSIDADDTGANLLSSPFCEPSGLNTCTVRVDRPTTDAPVSVRVTVQDPLELTNETPATAEINFVNLAPSEPLVSCDRAAPHGTNLTCTVSGATDPEGEELTYAWELVSDDVSGRGDLPTIVSDCDDSTTCTFTYPNPVDRVNVKVIATDLHGASSDDDTTVLFTNSAPEITNVVCSSPHEYSMDQTTCAVTVADDPEGDPYTISWSQVGATPSTCGDTETCEFTRSTPGAATTTVTVTDSWGASSSRTATAVFANYPPNATLTCDRTSTNKKGNPTVTCTAQVSDAGNTFTYDFTPSPDQLGMEVTQTASSSSYAVVVAPSGETGTWTPQVTITDPHGASVTVSGPPITVFDADPSLSLEGCTVNTNSWCQVRAIVSDPDDDNAQVNWPAAGEGGVPTGTDRQSCSDPAAATKNDPSGAVFQPVTCQYRRTSSGTHTITVSATSGGKTVSNTANITFLNQSPSLAVTVVSGNCDDAGHSGTSRACTLRATASDPEPGTLTFTFPTIPGLSRSGACNGSVSHAGGTNVTRDCTYTWSVPDSSAANRTRPPESSSWTLRANPLNKAVTVRDADGATTTKTTPSGFRYRAIANREAPSVSITCSAPGYGSVSGSGTLAVGYGIQVTCAVSASDPDGISHTSWGVSGDFGLQRTSCGANPYQSSCSMAGGGETVQVVGSARDFYCAVKRCATNGSDGSRGAQSGTIQIQWEEAPLPYTGPGGPPTPPGAPGPGNQSCISATPTTQTLGQSATTVSWNAEARVNHSNCGSGNAEVWIKGDVPWGTNPNHVSGSIHRAVDVWHVYNRTCVTRTERATITVHVKKFGVTHSRTTYLDIQVPKRTSGCGGGGGGGGPQLPV